MKMPIVSFKSMKMNESVCATCCYKLIISPSNYYYEVLNGGWLGDRPDNYPAWRDTVDAGWMEFPFDVDFYEGLAAVPFYDELKKEWWVNYAIDENRTAQVSLEDFMTGKNALGAKINEGCTHSNSECTYYAVIAPPLYREHFESTRPHITATGVYLAPHQALQHDS